MDNRLAEATAAIRQTVHIRPRIGAVLGSGLGGMADERRDSVSVPYRGIPHFPPSSVAGHSGVLTVVSIAGEHVCFLSGRAHCYEGVAMARVVFPVRVLAALGVQTLIVTNAAGAINPVYRPGDIVVIADHINLLGDHPLGPSDGAVDLSEAYDGRLKGLALRAAVDQGMTGRSGVYAAVRGPMYETPAEIRALRTMGADMVGMSTVPEVIMANSLGMRVLGLSLITNMAAGVSKKALSHDEVIETAGKVSAAFESLVGRIIHQVAP